MDSPAHTAPIEFEIVRENQVIADLEFITETVFRADAWTRQCTPPLLTLKLSTKTKLLQSQKSSPKLLPELTHGFISAHNPCWLRNNLGKLSRYRLRIHHWNWFQSWRMDLLVHKTFFWLWNSQRKLSRCRLRNHHRNCFKSLRMDSSAHTGPVESETFKENGVAADSKSSPKLLPQVMHGFVSIINPCWLRKSKGNQNSCALRNHHWNCIQSWRMD